MIRLPLITLVCLLAVTATAQEGQNLSPRERAESYENYALLLDRNMFNPDRRAPIRVDGERVVVEEEKGPEATPEPTQSLNFIGVWIENERPFAFFTGQGMEGGIREQDQAVAELKIAALHTTGAVLLDGDTEYILHVGQRLTRTGQQGPWKTEAASPSAGGGSFSSGRGSSSRPDSGGGGAPQLNGESRNALLEQMRQRRLQQESE